MYYKHLLQMVGTLFKNSFGICNVEG